MLERIKNKIKESDNVTNEMLLDIIDLMFESNKKLEFEINRLKRFEQEIAALREIVYTEKPQIIQESKVEVIKYDDTNIVDMITNLERKLDDLKNKKVKVTLTDILKNEGIEPLKGSVLVCDGTGIIATKAKQEGQVLTSDTSSIRVSWQSLKQ